MKIRNKLTAWFVYIIRGEEHYYANEKYPELPRKVYITKSPKWRHKNNPQFLET